MVKNFIPYDIYRVKKTYDSLPVCKLWKLRNQEITIAKTFSEVFTVNKGISHGCIT